MGAKPLQRAIFKIERQHIRNNGVFALVRIYNAEIGLHMISFVNTGYFYNLIPRSYALQMAFFRLPT